MPRDRLGELGHAPAHLADVVVALAVPRQAERATGGCQERVGQERVGRGPERRADGVLEQAMNEDHVRADRLGTGRGLLQDEAPEMRDELQIEGADERAGRAGARRDPAHLLQAQLERDGAALDHVEQPLGVAEGRDGRVGEDGVALELDEAQRFAQARDHELGQLGDDAVGVLELGVREKRGVAGYVGDDEVAPLARPRRRHGQTTSLRRSCPAR